MLLARGFCLWALPPQPRLERLAVGFESIDAFDECADCGCHCAVKLGRGCLLQGVGPHLVRPLRPASGQEPVCVDPEPGTEGCKKLDGRRLPLHVPPNRLGMGVGHLGDGTISVSRGHRIESVMQVLVAHMDNISDCSRCVRQSF